MLKENITGYTNAHEFRDNNLYQNTEQLFIQQGLTEVVENNTPPVCVNIAHLSSMEAMLQLQPEIEGKNLKVAIFGISSARGPRDLQDLLKSLGAAHVSTTALDISDGIFAQVEETGLDEVCCLERDARDSSLPDFSQDLVLRDHLGNCCPPNVDRVINQEVGRVIKPGGLSIVNITTSDLLPESQNRDIIPFEHLKKALDPQVLQALQNHVYDLKELEAAFPGTNSQLMKGKLLEIEPNGSFVVFGEDHQGHGEWFRSLADHLDSWLHTGFELVDIKSREGLDSHVPPLKCRRHNVILKKLI